MNAPERVTFGRTLAEAVGMLPLDELARRIRRVQAEQAATLDPARSIESSLFKELATYQDRPWLYIAHYEQRRRLVRT